MIEGKDVLQSIGTEQALDHVAMAAPQLAEGRWGIDKGAMDQHQGCPAALGRKPFVLYLAPKPAPNWPLADREAGTTCSTERPDTRKSTD